MERKEPAAGHLLGPERGREGAEQKEPAAGHLLGPERGRQGVKRKEPTPWWEQAARNLGY